MKPFDPNMLFMRARVKNRKRKKAKERSFRDLSYLPFVFLLGQSLIRYAVFTYTHTLTNRIYYAFIF